MMSLAQYRAIDDSHKTAIRGRVHFRGVRRRQCV